MLECGTGGVKVGMEGAQCVSKYVCETGKGMGGGPRADCPWRSPVRAGLNEVIARPLSICYRGSSSDQGVAMARWTQKGVAWERVQGSGVRVRGVKGHSQLDSTQEESRVRKEGGKVWFSFSFFGLSSLGSAWEGEEWTPLDINIELGQ